RQSQRTALSVSATGFIAYRRGGSAVRQLQWYDHAGTVLATVGGADASEVSWPAVSPDGSRIALTRTVQGNTDLWLLDGDRASRFTFDSGIDRFPVWSPKGDRLLFDSNRKGPRNLFVKPASNIGSETVVIESSLSTFANDWSRDGRFIIYTIIDPKTKRDLWVLP